jgi:hypothetical protein
MEVAVTQELVPPALTDDQDWARKAPVSSRKSWWRRPWLIPLALVAALFLLMRVPAVITLDPAAVPPVRLNDPVRFHHTVMLAHVFFGAIAWATVCLQLSSRLRQRHPRVHRVSGRIYVFAGMLPAATLALVLVPLTAWGPVAKGGMTVWAVLSLTITIIGFRMARARRFVEHRRMMLYSFGLAFAVLSGRLIAILVLSIPVIGPHIIAVTGGEVEGFWLGWMVNLALVHWWLRRTADRAPAGVASVV